jgi:hypothetical protein
MNSLEDKENIIPFPLYGAKDTKRYLFNKVVSYFYVEGAWWSGH